MAVVIGFLFLQLSFLNSTYASNVCSELFDPTPNKYELYNPNNMDQIIQHLIVEGEFRKIKQADPEKTNLTFFNDYIRDAIERLQKEKNKSDDPKRIKKIEFIIAEAQSRIETEQVTYKWVWDFSYEVLAVFEGKYNRVTLRNYENILNVFPRDIMIPTFAAQEFRHFIEMDGYNVTFLGMRETEQIVDGNEAPFSPEQFLNHDFLHYNLTQKGDHLLSLHDKNYNAWMKLHTQIKKRIVDLPEPQKSYVEFIYFYLLHEEFGIRDRLAYRALNSKIGKMSEYAEQVLDYELIKAHFYGITHPSKVLRSEIYKRTTKPFDFREAFPNKNPQEVLLEGISGFVNIIKDIESSPDFKRLAKKRFFLF